MAGDATVAAGLSWGRRACGYGLIVVCVPYAVLKVMWLTGSSIGVPADSPATSSGFLVANIITLGLDLVAIVLAFALTHRWGATLPAAPLLVAGWVGIGLLIPTVVQVPVGFGYGLLTTGRPVHMDEGLVSDHTYVLVYSSFALQGVLLTALFFSYARARWPQAVATSDMGQVVTARARVQRPIALAAAAGAVGVWGVHMVQAIAAPAGWHYQWTPEIRLSRALEGIVVLLAVPGVLAMVGSRLVPIWQRNRPSLATALTWTGSGALFAWGTSRTVVQLVKAPMSDLVQPVERITDFIAMLSGLTIGLLGILLLAATHDRVNCNHTPSNQPRGS